MPPVLRQAAPETADAVLRKLRQARWRLEAQRLAERVSAVLLFIGGLTVVVAVVDILGGQTFLRHYAAAILVGGLSGAPLFIFKRHTLADAARILDRRAGTRERCATALALAAQPDHSPVETLAWEGLHRLRRGAAGAPLDPADAAARCPLAAGAAHHRWDTPLARHVEPRDCDSRPRPPGHPASAGRRTPTGRRYRRREEGRSRPSVGRGTPKGRRAPAPGRRGHHAEPRPRGGSTRRPARVVRPAKPPAPARGQRRSVPGRTRRVGRRPPARRLRGRPRRRRGVAERRWRRGRPAVGKTPGGTEKERRPRRGTRPARPRHAGPSRQTLRGRTG